MRYRTLEIRWHDSKPISTCDFQPIPFKKARPSQEKNFASQSYKLATGGEDNHVRIWMVHPNILPPTLVETENATVTRPPRVEYLATLSRHTAPVNVARWSPNGELIASAGDDGMIIIWVQSSTPPPATYSGDLSAEDLQYEKEFWKPRTTFRCTTMQVYDLAWNPTGEYILAGSTDNCARVFTAADGKCIHEIAEHNHYVQGVAWDPLNEYIATQSSDRSMHVYKVSTRQGSFDVHAVGKNTRLSYNHSRTPSSQSRGKSIRRESASDVESVTTGSGDHKEDALCSTSQGNYAPPTPATSVASTPSTMFPPPNVEWPPSRRSSFSGSNAPCSPSHLSRYGRSPSPMPPLPAIRALPSPAWSTIKLYGDEGFTNFFRRLTFSPDGGLLLTPAGQFEDPSFPPEPKKAEGTPKKKTSRSSDTASESSNPNSGSSVFIYSRANFARPPIAQLPGHKKASVAVRFSPILCELRSGVSGSEGIGEAKTINLEKKEGKIVVDILGKSHDAPPPRAEDSLSAASVAPLSADAQSTAALSTTLPPRQLTPSQLSRPSTSTAQSTGSVFALPYRMLYAVLTMDTIAIYDTQQSGPICLLTKLHYDEFTDITWSPDGQCLILSSRDGYCTIIIFDEIFPAHHTQQSTLQLQSIAQHNFVPLTVSSTSSNSSSALPIISAPTVPAKRTESFAVNLPSLDNPQVNPPPVSSATGGAVEKKLDDERPPKKKRRLALTHVGDIESMI
ncbi:WD40-repeat-containing domain protein [Pisolithus orientalis]|uniref:WD40-repeat-containing domain protein n=1 Tax=Pisolithus orientalis TaxID=936130 RepID=UPI002224E1CF|nr:WD40-repeat-containing domain protein [Pisolithus orientalis]KAI6015134.1 WD40-repeat-containing domain protein [Pisolithus orientalis]